MTATQRGFLASPITSSVVDMPYFPMSRRNILSIGAALPFTSSVDQTGKIRKYFREEIQAKIDQASVKGGIVTIPPGIFEIDAPIEMRSGVSLVGSGRHYAYEKSGNKFIGSWIRYRGSSSQPAVRFRSVQHCSIKNLGVDCGESVGTTAVEIGSDNNPACKSLIFEEISIFGASVAVQWGIGNRLSKIEQCDDITFREIGVYSCDNGFIINAANSSDYSSISRVSMSNIKNIAFDLIGPGFLNIENCAIGSLGKKSIGFRITGSSPDPVNISNCQIEPYGTFLVAEGPNDEGQIILSRNVINNPVIVSGILRITSLNNYINSTINIMGFVRWRSRDDVWAGVHERPMHEPQVFASEDAYFLASSLTNASRYIGSYLPKNFVLENIDGPASGKVVIAPGIVCKEFVKGTEYSVGDYVRSKINNGVAYKVVSAGSFPIEPNWGNTRIKLGKLELEPVGAAAVFQSFGLLPR